MEALLIVPRNHIQVELKSTFGESVLDRLQSIKSIEPRHFRALISKCKVPALSVENGLLRRQMDVRQE